MTLVTDAMKRVCGRRGAARSCWSPARPGWARRRWWPRPPGPRSTTGRASCSATARRTWPPPTSSSPRRSATTSPMPPTTSCSPTSPPTDPSCPGWSRPWPTASRTYHRRGPPTPTPIGTSSSPPWSGCWPPPRRGQPVVLVLDDLQWADKASLRPPPAPGLLGSGPAGLVLGTHRDTELSTTHPLTETLAALRRLSGVSRIGSRVSTTAAWCPSGGGRRPGPGRRRGRARPCHLPGDRRQPLLRGRGAAPSHRDRSHLPGRDGRWVADDPSEQMPLPDSRARGHRGEGRPRLGERAGRVLSVASVIGRDFDLDLLARATGMRRGRTARRPRGRGRRRTGARAARRPRAVQLRPRPHPAHALRGPGPHPPGERTAGWPRPWRSSAGTIPGRGWANWPATGSHATQPIDLAKAVGYSRQAGDAALAALAPADALRYYAQALELPHRADDPDPVLVLDLAIGLGTAQRQTGDPAFRDTLLDAARRASDLGDTERLAAAALANDRGWYSSVGVIDAEKVAVLELALEHRLPADDPRTGAAAGQSLLRAHLRKPSRTPAGAGRRGGGHRRRPGDDAVLVRVLNHVCYPLYVPHMLDELLVRTADALRPRRLPGRPGAAVLVDLLALVRGADGRGHRRIRPLLGAR